MGLCREANGRPWWQVCDKLRIPTAVLDQIERQYYAEQSFNNRRAYGHSQSSYSGSQYRQQYSTPPQNELKQAYGVLGISENATDQEVKKAYRRLMSQHHPDKLVAKGLPESMVKLATEKTQKIQRAYEWICKARGI